jgi:hypothetical protein
MEREKAKREETKSSLERETSAASVGYSSAERKLKESETEKHKMQARRIEAMQATKDVEADLAVQNAILDKIEELQAPQAKESKKTCSTRGTESPAKKSGKNTKGKGQARRGMAKTSG